MKRESRCRPTENRFADRTPLLLCWYFTDDDTRLVAGRVCKGNVKVAVHFDFHINYAARECEPIILDPGTL
jgi:hypothetical protein